MNHLEVRTAIEEYVQSLLSSQADQLVFGNDPINSELFDLVIRCTTQFGSSVPRSLGANCWRTVGVTFFNIMVRPGVGTADQDGIAGTLTSAFAKLELAVSSAGTTRVLYQDQSRVDDPTERLGWVTATVSMAFYYDTEL